MRASEGSDVLCASRFSVVPILECLLDWSNATCSCPSAVENDIRRESLRDMTAGRYFSMYHGVSSTKISAPTHSGAAEGRLRYDTIRYALESWRDGQLRTRGRRLLESWCWVATLSITLRPCASVDLLCRPTINLYLRTSGSTIHSEHLRA